MQRMEANKNKSQQTILNQVFLLEIEFQYLQHFPYQARQQAATVDQQIADFHK
jgi:hypothetical protein